MVLEIKDTQHLKNQLSEAGDQLVVIDFFATWCGPCKQIAPKIEVFSKDYTNVVFLKVDVDECEEISAEYDISSMPTFVFIKNGERLETVVGANAEKILLTIEKHGGKTSSS